MYVCMYACMHVCMYACMHVCMYACMHVCMYACMHVCMYACMYVCMYVYMLNIHIDVHMYAYIMHMRTIYYIRGCRLSVTVPGAAQDVRPDVVCGRLEHSGPCVVRIDDWRGHGLYGSAMSRVFAPPPIPVGLVYT